MIDIESINETTFRVTVHGRTTTTHTVTVQPSYRESLVGDRASPKELVQKSFEFLLQRESNTSILSTFDLRVIGSYFPEYENAIRKLLP